MELRVLGPLAVLAEGGASITVRGAKQRALLALLVVHGGETVTAERLIDLLWPEAQPANPANALQAQVSQLRRALGSDGVVGTRPGGYGLEVAADHIDAARFEALAARGHRLLDDGDAAGASAVLHEALSLWRGPALADVVHDGPVQLEAARLDDLRIATIEAAWVAADLALGRHAELTAELDALTSEHPLREQLWAHRMVALYRSGRQADALRAYGEARQLLVDELGIEPGPELRRLESLVLAQDASLDAPVGSAPAPASDRPNRRRSNVPARLTRFVGRDEEVARLVAALRSDRLVTLVGPGGSGKTRLALEVADVLAAELPDGTWLVELAPLLEPEAVLPAVAAAVGLREGPAPAGQGPQPAGLVDRLVDHLGASSLVLVLDNCEHVVAEAASVAETLLGACPGLRVLATSREGLAVPGELLVPVGPLGPDDAVELFADRAGAVQPSFALDDRRRPRVEEVCTRLDGMPLAIELAAARVRSLPVEQVAARLGDRFRLLTGGSRTALPRQQTLRAVVDWSYDLLFEDERRLFDRLSVFAGGCDLDAAERVCGDDLLPAGDVLDLLSRLVDKSLVVARDDPESGVRYLLLQTLRHYARERLADSGDAPVVHRRHAELYLDLAEAAHAGLRGFESVEWRRRLSVELDNLRAALDWWAEEGDAERALRLVVGISFLWFLRAEHGEGPRWIGEALAVPGTAPARLRPLATLWHAFFTALDESVEGQVERCEEAKAELRRLGDPVDFGEAMLIESSVLFRNGEADRGARMLEEERHTYEQVGDAWSLGAMENFIAAFQLWQGRTEEAERHIVAAVGHFRACGDPWGMLESLAQRTVLGLVRGDYDGVVAASEERVALARECGFVDYEAFGLVHLGNVRTLLGDPAGGDRLLAESMEVGTTRWSAALALNGRGLAARRLGDLDRARRFHEEALGFYRAYGLLQGTSVSLAWLSWCASEAGDADTARARAEEALAAARVSHDERSAAFALEALAGAAVVAGDAAEAERLLAEAHALRLANGGALPPAERVDVDWVEARIAALVSAR